MNDRIVGHATSVSRGGVGIPESQCPQVLQPVLIGEVERAEQIRCGAHRLVSQQRDRDERFAELERGAKKRGAKEHDHDEQRQRIKVQHGSIGGSALRTARDRLGCRW
jgi:hypothetical protein